MSTAEGRIPGRTVAAVPVGAALAALALGSCGSTTTATAVYPYDEAYVTTTYYPADLIYAGNTWADDWTTSTIYYTFVGALPQPPEVTADGGGDGSVLSQSQDAGPAPSTSVTGVAGAIESLARGMSVCPGQVTVTPKNGPPACEDGSRSQQRRGVTIVFSGCAVGQSRIDGTVDVATVRSASGSTCGGATTIVAETTLTVTSLSVRQSSGAGVVIPSETATITASYPYGQTPSTVMANGSGEIQVFDASGKMVADLTTQGTETFALPNAQSYSFDGTQTVHDQAGSATATVTESGLTRSGGCCRPTGGTVVVDRTGGSSPGKVTWQFGPTCGEATRNGSKVALSACPQ